MIRRVEIKDELRQHRELPQIAIKDKHQVTTPEAAILSLLRQLIAAIEATAAVVEISLSVLSTICRVSSAKLSEETTRADYSTSARDPSQSNASFSCGRMTPIET